MKYKIHSLLGFGSPIDQFPLNFTSKITVKGEKGKISQFNFFFSQA